MPVMSTKSQLSMANMNFSALEGKPQEAGAWTLVAEIGSLSLEFTRLSQLSGDPKYFDAVQRIAEHFLHQQNMTRLPGMWPVVVNAKEARFTDDNTFTLGAMADSLYEYFPKASNTPLSTVCFRLTLISNICYSADFIRNIVSCMKELLRQRRGITSFVL